MTDLRLAEEVAARAARAGGDVVLRYYKQNVAVETKPDASPLTRADREANDAILAVLREAFPGDAIVSEESPGERLGARRVWIVDPLDGTRDFVAATDEFCVHVGLAIDGRAVAGAVYQPVAQAMFRAHEGGGAWCVDNGRKTRLQVSQRERAVSVGVSRLNASEPLVAGLAASGIATRAMGASTKHMVLAAGGLDAVIVVSTGEHDWDTCAPEIIIREAGGELTDLDGNRFSYATGDLRHPRGSVASNRACHAALLSLVQPWFA